MVPRLIFAALMFCSLASRPDGAGRRHPAPETRPVPFQGQPALVPAAACAPARP